MIRSFSDFAVQKTLSASDFIVGYNEASNYNTRVSFTNLINTAVTESRKVQATIVEDPNILFKGNKNRETLAILNQNLNISTYAINLSSSVTELVLSFGPLNRTKLFLNVTHGNPNTLTLSSFTAGISSSQVKNSSIGMGGSLIFNVDTYNYFTLFVQTSSPNSLLLTLTPSNSAEIVSSVPELDFSVTELDICRETRKARDNQYTGIINAVENITLSISKALDSLYQEPLSGISSDEWTSYTDCLKLQLPPPSVIASIYKRINNCITYPSLSCSVDANYPFSNLRPVIAELKDELKKIFTFNRSACNSYSSTLSGYAFARPSPSLPATLNVVNNRLENLVIKNPVAILNSENCKCS